MKKCLAAFLILTATAVWFWRCAPGGTPTESELRQTTGISAEVLGTRAAVQGVEITCRVSNATTSPAAHVVLNVCLNNAQGQTLAANPLAAVRDVPAGAFQDATFLIPLREPHPEAQARVKVTLVRWSK